ncbi:hypothetical protein BJ912DRAFT_1054337 [Pholiota molesta]|nr:hypothetical protein BJ912DRAFT_1054337 [Pholiota molesta]
MAPFTSYPAETLANLDHVSRAHEERNPLSELYNGCSDGSASKATNEGVSSTSFTPCILPSPGIELYAPLPAFAASVAKESAVPPIASSGTAEQSATVVHLQSPEVVCITLAFAQAGGVRPGVGQSVFMWTQETEEPAGNTHRSFLFAGAYGYQETSSPVSKESSLACVLEDEKLPVANLSEMKRLFTIGEEEGEFEERQSVEAVQYFTASADQQESPECPSAENEYETAVSQESGSSEQTIENDDLEIFSRASSSRTSMMSMDEIEDEETEEMGQVHRAQTQSIDIKRAVFIVVT